MYGTPTHPPHASYLRNVSPGCIIQAEPTTVEAPCDRNRMYAICMHEGKFRILHLKQLDGHCSAVVGGICGGAYYALQDFWVAHRPHLKTGEPLQRPFCLATKSVRPSLRFHCTSSASQSRVTLWCGVCVHSGWNKQQLGKLATQVTVDRFSQFHHAVTSSVAVIKRLNIGESKSQGYENSLGTSRATFNTVTQELGDISSAVSYGRLRAEHLVPASVLPEQLRAEDTLSLFTAPAPSENFVCLLNTSLSAQLGENSGG